MIRSDRAEGAEPLPGARTVRAPGAGGLTNNYRRQEDRTFARDNCDGKVNWNRTVGASDLGQVQLHERGR